ncbi:MAG TPA: hypothetical protein DCM86_07205 [Verrucomicrobiales bacterium]|nr:hypothetical protein [Verrucomicrobiales bacterium]
MPPTNPGTTPQGLINRNYRFPAEGSPIEERVLEIIQMAIDQSEGNITAAARLLGVNRDYLRYRLGMKTSKSDPPSPS